MCIALPNTEQHLHRDPVPADGGDAALRTPCAAVTMRQPRATVRTGFPDALARSRLRADWTDNPVGTLGTLRRRPLATSAARACCSGDAAHAMVPFHGQGMNCAFEDCLALARTSTDASDWTPPFAAFEAERSRTPRRSSRWRWRNYVEMRDQVGRRGFLLQRQLERVLAERHPGRFVPRYSMVTFLRDALLARPCCAARSSAAS
jgi:kynurenine 3-monooxygenase